MMSRYDKFILSDKELADLYTKKRAPNPKTAELNYGRNVRAAVRGLWRTDFDFIGFVNLMELTIRSGFTRAWYEGIASCGFLPSDMSFTERARLDQEIANEINYVTKFAIAIHDQAKVRGGKLTPLLQRSQMWSLRYNYIRDLAKTYACGDQKLEWQIGVHCKEHCRTCLSLNGKVYRASTWRLYDISPQSHRLECRGYHCCCAFVNTTKPVTPGPFPTI